MHCFKFLVATIFGAKILSMSMNIVISKTKCPWLIQFITQELLNKYILVAVQTCTCRFSDVNLSSTTSHADHDVGIT